MTSWEDLEAGLVATLPRLTERCVLVLEDLTPGSTAPDVEVLVGPLDTTVKVRPRTPDPLGENQTEQMTGLGWAWEPASRVWTMTLPRPALTAETRHAASAVTTALHHVYAQSTPEHLTYRAWRTRQVLPDGFYTEEQLDNLDPGQNPLPLPQLGLPVGTLDPA